MKSLKIACIGECMIELQETSPGVTRQTFGGDTLNTAIYCSRLGQELPLQVDYVTALGQDGFSQRMISFWESEGVRSDLVQQHPNELPGLYYIELNKDGERVFHYWRSAAAAKKCFEYPGSEKILEKLFEYDGVYLSGISLAILNEKSRLAILAQLEKLAEKGRQIFFDCNFRPLLWKDKQLAKEVYQQLYSISSIVFLTIEEAEILLEVDQKTKACQKLLSLGAREVVLKDGENPCLVCFADSSITVPGEFVERVVDTTAAGDSFSATYMVARMFNCSPDLSAKMAHKTAAHVICHKGAVAPVEGAPVTGKDILSIIESSSGS